MLIDQVDALNLVYNWQRELLETTRLAALMSIETLAIRRCKGLNSKRGDRRTLLT